MEEYDEVLHQWADKYISKTYRPYQVIDYLIHVYQDCDDEGLLVADVYYNTITSQYKVKSYCNKINYCADNLVEIIDCINTISERTNRYGECYHLIRYIDVDIFKYKEPWAMALIQNY
jgi:hypothetical protein